MERHICVVCAHEHNEESEGNWNTLLESFSCPVCGTKPDEYYTLESKPE